MSRYDEHGPVEEIEREHGPEWWAMGGEFCKCEHYYDEHAEGGNCTHRMVGEEFALPDSGRFIAGEHVVCGCHGFTPLDNR